MEVELLLNEPQAELLIFPQEPQLQRLVPQELKLQSTELHSSLGTICLNPASLAAHPTAAVSMLQVAPRLFTS